MVVIYRNQSKVLCILKKNYISLFSFQLTAATREPRSCVLRQRQERSALQRLLEYLLKALEKKDPKQLFAWPVTDHIAPGYSSIISQPMDFSTMKQKIDNGVYITLPQFIVSNPTT